MSTFHHLSRLPPELRTQIWQRTMSPRLVPLIIKTNSAPLSSHHHIFTITSIPSPAILQVCKESRAVALMHYTLSFPTAVDYTSQILAGEPQVWFDYDNDIAWLEAGSGNARASRRAPDRLAMLLSAENRNKVKHLAVGSEWQGFEHGKYPGVESFVIVFGKTEYVGTNRVPKGCYDEPIWSWKEWEYEDAISEEWLRTPVAFHELKWQQARDGGFIERLPRIRIIEIL